MKMTVEELEKRIKINKKLLEYVEKDSIKYMSLELDIMRCENTKKCLICKNALLKAKKQLEKASATAFDNLYKYEIDKLIIELDYLISYYNDIQL